MKMGHGPRNNQVSNSVMANLDSVGESALLVLAIGWIWPSPENSTALMPSSLHQSQI